MGTDPRDREGKSTAEPRYLAVGLIRSAHGLRGEVRLELLTDFPERFQPELRLYLGPEQLPFTVERLRLHRGYGILKLAEVGDRTEAEALRGMTAFVPREEAVSLEEGTYYEHQIVGLSVHTTEGKSLGRVKEILYTGANEVYVVEGLRGEVLLPAIPECILDVDLERGRLTVQLLPGL